MNTQDWDNGMEQLLVEELNSKGRVNALVLKDRALDRGLVNPGHFNRIGGLMRRLVIKHRLVKSGDKVTAGREAHRRPVAVWKRGPASSIPEPVNGPVST